MKKIDYKQHYKEAMDGWDRTLKGWKKWSNIWFVTSIINLILGILLGFIIGVSIR